MKKIICFTLAIVLTLSFTAFAVDFTCLSTTVKNGASSVYVKEGTITKGAITINFSDVIDETTLASITMGEDGSEFDGFTASLNGSNSVDITFDSDLKYDTEYVIYYPGVKSSSGASVIGLNSLSFTTESEPDINVEKITFTKGVGSTVSEPTDLKGDGSIQGIKVELSNKADTPKKVNVVCAFYENNIIKKVLTSEKTVDATSTEFVEIGTVIGTNFAGGFVKIFVWNNLADKTPFVASESISIIE